MAVAVAVGSGEEEWGRVERTDGRVELPQLELAQRSQCWCSHFVLEEDGRDTDVKNKKNKNMVEEMAASEKRMIRNGFCNG